jgi:pyruvate ferredoxin oxidoreductase delta subunit
MYCPDAAILVTDHKISGVDYEHCKGCGICAVECPKKCIDMSLDIE